MDGGMGSTVEDRGIQVRNALWGSFSLLTPEGIAVNDEIHRDFVEVGAEILVANTHNSLLMLCEAFFERDDAHGVDLPEEVREAPASRRAEALQECVIRRAVESARGALPETAEIVVAVCAGSPEGPYATESTHSPEEIARLQEPQVRAFADVRTDLVLFETLTTASEIEGVARLARQTGLTDFGIGLTCGEDGRTMGGVSMAGAVEMTADAEPSAFFMQCTPFRLVHAALRELVSALEGRSVAGVYANDGRVWRDMRWHGERTSPEEYADEAMRWRDGGARIIGGCCGTAPVHIAELRRRLREE
jgi:homocysteine S-methyltransferase